MEAFEYAGLDNALDYLYEFFDKDLAQRVAENKEFVPAGLEDVLGDNDLYDYVWLWIKEPGPNGFRQYIRDGGYPEDEVKEAFLLRRDEWGRNTPPHVEWLEEDGFQAPEF